MASIRSSLVALYLSDARRDLRRRRHRLTRGGRRVFTYVHQVDDPYGLLMVQVLPRLVEAADAELRVVVLPSPTPEFMPDVERLRGWALIDAARLARQHDLRFPANASPPEPEMIARAQAIALDPRPWAEHLELLRDTGHALLGGEALDRARAQQQRQAEPRLAANRARVHALGHYQGGMLHYEGEWFWALDRLAFVEQRLRDEGLDIPPTLDPHAAPHPEPVDPGAELELFYSLRSPYSYLALDRTLALAERHAVPLKIRLVLPMVMRGLAVPWAKRRYIVTDAKRIAGALGIPFGRIADPLGPGTERGLAVAALAEPLGLLPQWLASFGAGVWSEGVDAATDRGLSHLATRAGLDAPAAVAAAQGPDSWRPTVDANREELLRMGLWGVPSYRLGELVIWGQDRLPVLDAALAAR